MKEILLTQGKVALVDDEDFDRVNQFKWHALKARNTYYACRTIEEGTEYLHTFLLGVKGVDHRDRNGLNDRRENLRLATPLQNSWGPRKKRRGVSSQYRGVHWQPSRRLWRSEIRADNKTVFLGRFLVEEDAARAYDAAAIKAFGEFACPNFAVSKYRPRPSKQAMLSLALWFMQ